MKFCVRCGTQLPDEAAFCSACGNPCNSSAGPQQTMGGQDTKFREPEQDTTEKIRRFNLEFFDRLTGKVNELAGGSGAVRPPLRDLFSQVLKKHSQKEAEEIFICGTSTTTPELTVENTVWPQPWLYVRVLLAFAAAFVMMSLCSGFLNNRNGIPGTLIMGSFMVPVAILVFFFELNTPKNISFFNTIKIFMVGGCASLLVTLLLFELTPVVQSEYIDAILTGIVEELGKMAIVAYLIYKEKDMKFHVNGLLIGAAVGAGFAAFESAGYAFRYYMDEGFATMMEVIYTRAILAPGGHVVWAAMAGYAIMLVKGDGPLTKEFIKDKRFWLLFWMPIALHALWDMPIAGYAVWLCEIIVSWAIIFVFINNSLNQIATILAKRAAEAAVQANPALESGETPAECPQ